jgi:nicotinate-nucleotide pyrophosphorylase (carboxylating)
MLTRKDVAQVIDQALLEDAPWGDITSNYLIDAEATAHASLVAREAGIWSGGAVIEQTFLATDENSKIVLNLLDGERFEVGTVIAEIWSNARALLRAERVALNLTQRMSGIATLTSLYVEQTLGTAARIVDTRKTTPGLRLLERHAVRCGGGFNHRFSLSDAVLAKDNHLAILTAGGKDLTTELIELRKRLPHTTHLEVEVDSIEQIEEVLAASVDTVMLDNFSLEDLKLGVAMIGNRANVEASGGVNLQTVRQIAETGVDIISVGALTHSARALDLGLDISITKPEAH